MADQGCSLCGQTGFLPVKDDETRVQQCICTYARTMKAHLGPELVAAPTITRSPLYTLGDSAVDRTKDNLFLKIFWSDLLPHLKWALVCKGPLFRYRIVTDEKLKTVWLGNESYQQRAKGKRDEMVTFNSVGDLVGPDYDLVIIRLGFLGHKNVAMPGILKEALMLRESGLKPTWIVEEPSSIFGQGHFSYSDDVGSYIERLFEVINLVDETRPLEEPRGTEDTVSDVGLGDKQPQAVRPVKARFEAPNLVSLFGGDSPKGSKKPAWKRNKNNGGGPLG